MRFQFMLVVAFGLTAWWLTVIGIAALVAQTLAGRVREIGIRRALGATDRSVALAMLDRVLTPIAAGVFTGAIVALNLASTMRWALFGIEYASPTVYVIVAGVVAATAFLMAYACAVRARSVDPIGALRTA